MYKKKFKPVITRVKLNPEQAVLTCPCYQSSVWQDSYANKGSTLRLGCGTAAPRPTTLRYQCSGTTGTSGFQIGGSSGVS